MSVIVLLMKGLELVYRGSLEPSVSFTLLVLHKVPLLL